MSVSMGRYVSWTERILGSTWQLQWAKYFSKIDLRSGLSPTSSERKGEKFVWTDERQESIEELKRRLVSAPILTHPSSSGVFQYTVMPSKKAWLCFDATWKIKEAKGTTLCVPNDQALPREGYDGSLIVLQYYSSSLPTIIVGILASKAAPFRALYGFAIQRVKTFWDQGHAQSSIHLSLRFLERIGEVSVSSGASSQFSLICLCLEPESILDRQERVMRNKSFPYCEDSLTNRPEREATWETKSLCDLVILYFFV
ncbi:hypothetical protein Tco_1505905 [Tanacetum coccineum]